MGLIAVWLPNVYGVGYSTISLALAGSLGAALMAVLVVAKIAATSITIGSAEAVASSPPRSSSGP